MERLMVIALTAMVATASAASNYPDPCDSAVYCKPGPGSLLHTVQMARLYEDSKTFVDKPLRHSESQVLKNFELFMRQHDQRPSKEQVQSFVDDNFLPEGNEFVDWEPEDWQPNPAVLGKINDSEYHAFAKDIHGRWKDLGRKIRPGLEADRTSLIIVERPFIVPGGRFREFHYWDSYWTILGLLTSEMEGTVRGMLENFSHLVSSIGHIPNGNRIYFVRRSQPPLFISMMHAYYTTTDDIKFVEKHIGHMEDEFNFWMDNRMMDVAIPGGQTYSLATYNVEVDGPRPESYYEDYRDASNFSTPAERLEFYMNMKSGAESGLDYMTKWFIDPDSGEDSQNLLHIQTRHIVPVELNSYLCRNARIMAEFYEKLGRPGKAREFRDKFGQIRTAIDKVLWNEDEGAWFDYDTKNGKQRKYFYITSVGPLWADCYPKIRTKDKIKPYLNYLRSQKQYVGGVPSSMVRSGQQWDFSNAWPPQQEMLISGLENTGDPEAADMALKITHKWVKNNWAAYEQSGGKMFEKFDVEQVGLPGGAGEYNVQEGFGWTNGVLLSLFDRYGDRIAHDATTRPEAAAPRVLLVLTLSASMPKLVFRV